MEVKNPTTFEEQIEQLKKHGCIIDDYDFCMAKLHVVNYYRLSAYFLPFKNRDDKYIPGTTFSKIFAIYEFDRELRNLLFSAIEEIEVFWKCQLSYFHSHKYGSLGYLDKNNFSDKHNQPKFLKLLDKELENHKKSLFVKHHFEKYDGNFPLWVISELFTF